MAVKYKIVVLKSTNKQTTGLLSIKKSNGCWQERLPSAFRLALRWFQSMAEGALPIHLKEEQLVGIIALNRPQFPEYLQCSHLFN